MKKNETVHHIRPAVVADVGAMFRVRGAVGENTMSAEELAALGITPTAIAQAVASGPCAWVATVQGEVVGFAMVDLEDACLFALFVVPAFEGKGIGTALARACEAALFAQHGCAWLETAQGSRAAHLYRHWGWGNAVDIGDGDIRMEKRRPAHAHLIEAHPAPPLQPALVALVDDVRGSLCAHLGQLLDSLYLYGSVSRAAAQLGVSDLDVTVVLARPLTASEQDALERLRRDLQLRHPEVSKIDFDLGTREEVLAPANLYSWGYWLKHECRCIYGADLGLQFAPFAPSREVALAVNGDYVQVLGDYAARLAAAQGADEIHRLQKEAARKLVRATHVLRPLSDSYWPRTLEDYAAYFVRHHPNMAEQIAFFLAHARAPWAPVAMFNDRLHAFTDWMQRRP